MTRVLLVWNKLNGTIGSLRKYKTDLILVVDFQSFITRETTFVTSCLLSCSPSFFWKGIYSTEDVSQRMTNPTKWHVRPAKTQISLGIRPVWSESSQSAWRKLGSLTIHWAQSEDSDQTGWMPRLIWVFPGRNAILWVLSCAGSYGHEKHAEVQIDGRMDR